MNGERSTIAWSAQLGVVTSRRDARGPRRGDGLALIAQTSIDEHELVVVGESGALLRVDLVVGEALLLHDRKHTMGPTQVTAAATGQAVISNNTMLHLQPADPVPRDSPGLQAWLSQRTQ